MADGNFGTLRPFLCVPTTPSRVSCPLASHWRRDTAPNSIQFRLKFKKKEGEFELGFFNWNSFTSSKAPSGIFLTEIAEDGAVIVRQVHVCGEVALVDSHQKAFGDLALLGSVIEIKVNFGIVADMVTKITHAEVKMMGEDLLCWLFTECSATLKQKSEK